MIYRPARKLADLSPEVARLVLRLGAVLRPRPLSYQEITEAVLRRTEGVWVCPPMVRRVLAGVPGLLTLTDTAASMIGFVSTGSISPDFETGSPPGRGRSRSGAGSRRPRRTRPTHGGGPRGASPRMRGPPTRSARRSSPRPTLRRRGLTPPRSGRPAPSTTPARGRRRQGAIRAASASPSRINYIQLRRFSTSRPIRARVAAKAPSEPLSSIGTGCTATPTPLNVIGVSLPSMPIVVLLEIGPAVTG